MTNNRVLQAREFLKNKGFHIATKQDISRLSDIAADAYENYPLHNWFGNGKYDKYMSRKIIEISLLTMMKNGVIYSDKERNGFAIWMPEGFTGSKTLPFLFNGGFSIIKKSGFSIISKLLSYENFAMKLKKQFTQHQDWYLYNLSVKPDAQGQGIGKSLVSNMLEFCKMEKIKCYLETNKRSNVGLYQKLGFQCVEDTMVPNSDVRHFAMVCG